MTPGGLKIGQTEFFWDDAQGWVLHSGQLLSIEQMPEELFVIVDAAMNDKHSKALDRMGILDPDRRRLKFLKCNAGTFDFTPDIQNGAMQLEYVTCPERGRCSEEGHLCQPLLINGHKISMAELRIISLIRQGKYDKEICDELSIAPQTLRTHKQNIERKLNADRKVQVALKAVEYGII